MGFATEGVTNRSGAAEIGYFSLNAAPFLRNVVLSSLCNM